VSVEISNLRWWEHAKIDAFRTAYSRSSDGDRRLRSSRQVADFNASFFYDSIPDTVSKYYVEFSGASHFLTTNDLGTADDGQSKYMIAFYKVYLEDDMRYLDVLNGPMDAELSQYKKSK
jgi:hypothetical protein